MSAVRSAGCSSLPSTPQKKIHKSKVYKKSTRQGAFVILFILFLFLISSCKSRLTPEKLETEIVNKVETLLAKVVELENQVKALQEMREALIAASEAGKDIGDTLTYVSEKYKELEEKQAVEKLQMHQKV